MPWERARRRLVQRLQRAPDDEEIAAEVETLVQRDLKDEAQTQQAADAILLDTTFLTQEEQVERIVAMARQTVIREYETLFEKAGLKPVAMKLMQMSKPVAEGFYAVHKARPFFNDLVAYMISGPVMLQVLEGENAVLKNREIMGATDPKKADKGTIRADFADSIDANAVHGSDGPDTAKVEVAYFFPELNVYSGR